MFYRLNKVSLFNKCSPTLDDIPAGTQRNNVIMTLLRHVSAGIGVCKCRPCEVCVPSNSNVTMSQQNFAHVALLCYVQHFVAITVLVVVWEKNEIPITF